MLPYPSGQMDYNNNQNPNLQTGLQNFQTVNRQVFPNHPVVQESFTLPPIYQPLNRNFYQNNLLRPEFAQSQNSYLETQQNFQKAPLDIVPQHFQEKTIQDYTNVVPQHIQEQRQDYTNQLSG